MNQKTSMKREEEQLNWKKKDNDIDMKDTFVIDSLNN